MPRKKTVANKRLANRVIWALEDIAAITADLWGVLGYARDRAERLQDPILLARLGEIGQGLASIERKTRGARNGEYID